MAACVRLLTDSFGERAVDKKTHQRLTKIPNFCLRNFPVPAIPVVAGAFLL